MSVYTMTQNNSQLMTQNNWRHMFVDAIKSGEVTLKQKAREERADLMCERFNFPHNRLVHFWRNNRLFVKEMDRQRV